MGCRTDPRLAQSKPPPGKRLRGDDCERQNLGLHRLRATSRKASCVPHDTTYTIKIRTLRQKSLSAVSYCRDRTAEPAMWSTSAAVGGEPRGRVSVQAAQLSVGRRSLVPALPPSSSSTLG